MLCLLFLCNAVIRRQSNASKVTRLEEFSHIWYLFTLDNFSEILFKSRPHFWTNFLTAMVMHFYWQKMGWASCWAFLQTRLVTLNAAISTFFDGTLNNGQSSKGKLSNVSCRHLILVAITNTPTLNMHGKRIFCWFARKKWTFNKSTTASNETLAGQKYSCTPLTNTIVLRAKSIQSSQSGHYAICADVEAASWTYG
jgi:hypothetical protein